MKWDANYFKYFPFTIPLVKLLQELPFYDELSIARNSNAFCGYVRSYI